MILAETIIFMITNIFVNCDHHSYELIRNNQRLLLYKYSAYKILCQFLLTYPIFKKNCPILYFKKLSYPFVIVSIWAS